MLTCDVRHVCGCAVCVWFYRHFVVIIVFLCTKGKNRGQCARGPENRQHEDIRLQGARCSRRHHWRSPCAYWLWQFGQSMQPSLWAHICPKPPVSLQTCQVVWGLSKTFCWTWKTAPKTKRQVYKSQKEASCLANICLDCCFALPRLLKHLHVH